MFGLSMMKIWFKKWVLGTLSWWQGLMEVPIVALLIKLLVDRVEMLNVSQQVHIAQIQQVIKEQAHT